jgi:hypothetical protein
VSKLLPIGPQGGARAEVERSASSRAAVVSDVRNHGNTTRDCATVIAGFCSGSDCSEAEASTGVVPGPKVYVHPTIGATNSPREGSVVPDASANGWLAGNPWRGGPTDGPAMHKSQAGEPICDATGTPQSDRTSQGVTAGRDRHQGQRSSVAPDPAPKESPNQYGAVDRNGADPSPTPQADPPGLGASRSLALARRAVVRINARKGEDVDEWGRRLASDSVDVDFEVVFRVVCWCGAVVRQGTPGAPVSHGPCPPCFAAWRAERRLPELRA